MTAPVSPEIFLDGIWRRFFEVRDSSPDGSQTTPPDGKAPLQSSTVLPEQTGQVTLPSQERQSAFRDKPFFANSSGVVVIVEDIFEKLIDLLFYDPILAILYVEALDTIPIERLEFEFWMGLKLFAIELRHEAKNLDQRDTATFIREDISNEDIDADEDYDPKALERLESLYGASRNNLWRGAPHEQLHTVLQKDIQGAFGVAGYITAVITMGTVAWQMWEAAL
ncbi:hypothetical protein G7Y89_g2045 [Cudoniella acicularis]|uniref:Uncharacterized protein n=1 Tax=Cudoniella acicularis TaxID=354080 RepID=A0A8H4RU15_9HELO|nr:hypothetical protein G7Y89_g2045 [Cudoniella acicularis]